MYCPKCGKEVNTGKKFCNECGSRLLDNDTIESNITIEASSGSKVIDTVSMVEAYVGSKYDKIKSTGFSLWFLLFGPYYLLYRKMYIWGGLYILLNILLILYAPNFIFITGIITILLSIRFNNLYLSYVAKKVDRLARDAGTDDRASVLKMCRVQGGANIYAALAGMAIYVYFTYGYFENLTNSYLTGTGLVSKTAVEDYKDLEFKSVSEIKKETSSDGKVIYNYDKDDDSCSYSIEVSDSTNSAKQFLNSKTTYTAKDEKKDSTISINNNTWNLLEVKTTSGVNVYDYAIVKDHVLYNFTYRIYSDSGKCSNIRNKVVNSLSFKK